MTKALATLATLLLAGTLGFAQASQPGMQSGQPDAQSSHSNMGQNAVRGCLAGTRGNFRLMAEDGTTYQLKGQTSKLSKNVGKEVEIQTSSTIGGEGASASGSMAGQSASAHASQTLQVQNVTQIADTCQTGAGAGSTPGGMHTPPPGQ